MRSNIVSEAGLPTRLNQWWEGIPFLTSAVVVVCGIIYFVCLLVGYDSFVEVCFLPSAVVSHFQVYRIYTAILFHGSLLHVLFNMLALVPMGSELERIMGSIRLLYVWILLAVFQLLMTNISFLGHLCGILSGYAYTFGLFNVLIPGTSFYSSIESSSWICLAAVNVSGLLSGNMWRNLSSWMPQRESSVQTAQDSDRFPGRGRSLGSSTNQAASLSNSDSSLQTRLLDDGNNLDQASHPATIGGGQRISDGELASYQCSLIIVVYLPTLFLLFRPPVVNSAVMPARTQNQGSVASEDEVQKLLAMGFDKVEVAMAAADGDLNVAVEILMSQQGSELRFDTERYVGGSVVLLYYCFGGEEEELLMVKT
ncbi:hypothetical protein DH2020_014840 [Rehmannia glutinosa]|uniref:Peptidase S54 rhomboid domain-containing protein n=1 Tax=Rehmannia glutinosa TaxID=99300 RepID=A0ABR0X1G9_REHGL